MTSSLFEPQKQETQTQELPQQDLAEPASAVSEAPSEATVVESSALSISQAGPAVAVKNEPVEEEEEEADVELEKDEDGRISVPACLEQAFNDDPADDTLVWCLMCQLVFSVIICTKISTDH